ncbi:MAG: hypothetical protein ACXAAI_00400 [Promethearchaeota archaeon]|jgi:hypothetical protein
MIFLIDPTGYYDYFLLSQFGTVLTAILLPLSLFYLYRSRVVKKGVLIYGAIVLLTIIIPLMIYYGLPALLWGLERMFVYATIIIIVYIIVLIGTFIIVIYIVYTRKKKIGREEIKPEIIPQKKNVREELGLKIGTVILIIGSSWTIITSFLGGFSNIVIPSLQVEIQITTFLLGYCVLLLSVYNYYRKQFSIFGYVFCLIGTISMILFPIVLTLLIYPFFLLQFGVKHLLFGAIVLIGLVINQRGNEKGSLLCLAIGGIDLILNFPLGLVIGYYYLGGGFLNMFFTLQFEPFLIFIGGYFLYQEQQRPKET